MAYSREHQDPIGLSKMQAVTFLSLLICFVNYPCWAQTSVALEKADQLYQNQGYHAAAVLYESVGSELAAVERLANSYRLNHDTYNAEIHYALLVGQSDNPLFLLHYAQALHGNGKLELAKEFYLKYDRATAGQDDQRGSQMATAIDRMSKGKSDDVFLENVSVINSEKSDFSPSFYQNGVVFVSTRTAENNTNQRHQMKDNWTGDDFSALYLSVFQVDGLLTPPVLFSTGLDAKFHEGPMAFSKNGDRLLYTRNISPKKNNASKTYFLKIAAAVKEGKLWLKDGMLDLGAENCNDVHPTLSADGLQLVFASDRPGGYGGMDLYISQFSNGNWGLPINLGPAVNTVGNEVFPFLYDEGTLYFASDGWGGFGGLDVFHCQPNETADWEQAANLGQPFNSNKDDFGYVLKLTGTDGYLTSDRAGGMGKDDIYHFTLPRPQSNKLNYFPNTTLCVADEMDGQPIAGASVTVFTKAQNGEYKGYENGHFVKLARTGADGNFEKEVLQADPFATSGPLSGQLKSDEGGQFDLHLSKTNDYLFHVKMAGYEDVYHFHEKNNEEKCIAIRPANFTYLQGRVIDKQSGNAIPHASITLFNLRTSESTAGLADASGNYQFRLENGSDFILKATKEHFTEDNALVSTFQINGKSGLVNRDLQLMAANPEMPATFSGSGNVFENGFLIELELIYYDYGQSGIRADAAKELDQIALFLLRYPNLSIELRSHTDSRGEAIYNKELSQLRAKNATDYLVGKGIPIERVTAVGMGEDQLLNDCKDGKECPEEEHQVNRRTEVRFFEK